jgi:hypothetical protein
LFQHRPTFIVIAMLDLRLLLIPVALLTSRPALAEESPVNLAAKVDVAVYGATPCGIASAIAAAREGVSVVLLNPKKHVGGLSTSGINTAETEHMLKWTIGGIALEFYEHLGKHYGTGHPEFFFESSVAEQVYLDMLKEAGVPVLRVSPSLSAASESKDRPLITGLYSEPNHGGAVHAKVYIDATYEGDLMKAAGVKYAVGRESQSEFGEEAAGIRFDKTSRQARTVDEKGNLLPGISAWAKDLKEGQASPAVMNYNFRLTVTNDPAFSVPIPAPANYNPARYALLADWLRDKTAHKQPVKLGDVLDLYKRRNHKYELNNKQASIISLGHFGGQFDWPEANPARRAEIYKDHLDYTLGLLKFLATDESVPENMRAEMKKWGLHKDEFADNGNLPYELYVREARRMRGAYVVTQKDVQEERRKPDAIGMSSHFIDCHHVQRVALNDHEFVNEGRIWRIGYAWQIPYRALTPKQEECGNLLVPGAASLSHVAYCTYRLESVWMIAGHAAGVAAAMAAKTGVPVQLVDVPKLQDRLRAQKQVVDFIPGQPEKNDKLNGPPEF